MTKVLLPYPIPTNRMWRSFRGRITLSAEAKAWKTAAAFTAKLAGMQRLKGDVTVELTLHPRMNKDGGASAVRVDLDGAIKCTLDSLNGVAYDDDKQITRLVAFIGAPVKDGGLTVEVW